jgi:hypothetical protein
VKNDYGTEWVGRAIEKKRNEIMIYHGCKKKYGKLGWFRRGIDKVSFSHYAGKEDVEHIY